MTEPGRHPVCGCPVEPLRPNRADRRWMARNRRHGDHVTLHARGCPLAVSRDGRVPRAGRCIQPPSEAT